MQLMKTHDLYIFEFIFGNRYTFSAPFYRTKCKCILRFKPLQADTLCVQEIIGTLEVLPQLHLLQVKQRVGSCAQIHYENR